MYTCRQSHIHVFMYACTYMCTWGGPKGSFTLDERKDLKQETVTTE